MSKVKVLDKLLYEVIELGASDLHLMHNNQIVFRIDGRIVKSEKYVRGADIFKILVDAKAISDAQLNNFHIKNEADFAYELDGIRFRGNLAKDKGEYTCVIRRLSDHLFSIEEMGLPDFVKDEIKRTYGMILVTGPTGSGKTTTLSSLINYLNEELPIHIATIEEPIEFVHKPKKAIITQQEVKRDTPTFSSSMSSILRRDPDVILIGEMRELETIETACVAAETGHLVFGTLHTNTAISSIDRITSVFPHLQQQNIRSQLASNLRMIINQRLIPKKDKGRVPAYEIMVVNKEMRTAIRNGDLEKLEELMENDPYGKSITMDQSIQKLKQQGLIDGDVYI